jgi:hypothetical protein
VSRLANRRPDLYEKRFAWLWPAWFLIFKLRKLPVKRCTSVT